MFFAGSAVPCLTTGFSEARITPAPTTANAAITHHRLLPAERGGDQREQRGQHHLADVAGEIVGAERGARAQAGIGRGHQARRDGMLRAAAQARQQAGPRSRRRASR